MSPRTPAALQLLLEALGTAAGRQRQMVAPPPPQIRMVGGGAPERPLTQHRRWRTGQRGWPSTARGLAEWEEALTEDEHAAPVDHGRVVVAGGWGGPGGEGPGGRGSRCQQRAAPSPRNCRHFLIIEAFKKKSQIRKKQGTKT